MSPPAASEVDAERLAQKYDCLACHAVAKKLVAPSFKDIARKYSGDKSAVERLKRKVKNGGSGVWGAIPMPPMNVPEVDMETLVEWILSRG